MIAPTYDTAGEECLEEIFLRIPEDMPKNPAPTCPDSLLQALRSQLMRYARNPSPPVAGIIANCLDSLLAHPQFKIPPEERCTYRQMRIYWRLVESLD